MEKRLNYLDIQRTGVWGGIEEFKNQKSKLRNFFCHSHESGNPDAVPAEAGNYLQENWIPAFSGIVTSHLLAEDH